MAAQVDGERVTKLLFDTIVMLSKNSVRYSSELKIQGLIGLTIDTETVYLIHFNDVFPTVDTTSQIGTQSAEASSSTSASCAPSSATVQVCRAPPSARRRLTLSGTTPVKHERPTPVHPQAVRPRGQLLALPAPPVDDDDLSDMSALSQTPDAGIY